MVDEDLTQIHSNDVDRRTDEQTIELRIELPFVTVAPRRFSPECIESAKHQARKVRREYPAAKVELKWVKVTKVRRMKDVESMAVEALAARDAMPPPTTAAEAMQEPHAVEVPRPAPGSWAR